MHARIRPLLLLAFLLSAATSHAFFMPRPVQTEGKLMIGWAFGEIAAIGEHKMIGFTGELHEALRGCNDLELRLTGLWATSFILHVTRVELLEEPPALDEIIRLHGVLHVEGESFRIGQTSFRASGPLVKGLSRSAGVNLDVEATRDGESLRVISLEVLMPTTLPGFPAPAAAR